MKHTLTIALVAGSLLTAGGAFAAGTPQTKTTTKTTATTTQTTAPAKSDVPADLAKEAKISLETARATALAKVPHGVVRSEELEREHGKLIYSFDIAVPGKPGIQEVNVNAISGKVLGVHHETAKDEQKEAAKEHKPSGR
ncbi:MAG: PepSY domain-containing protein [Thermoanaerobaculia bacterium]